TEDTLIGGKSTSTVGVPRPAFPRFRRSGAHLGPEGFVRSKTGEVLRSHFHVLVDNQPTLSCVLDYFVRSTAHASDHRAPAGQALDQNVRQPFLQAHEDRHPGGAVEISQPPLRDGAEECDQRLRPTPRMPPPSPRIA